MTPKSAQAFHDRSAQQVDDFKSCVELTARDLLNDQGSDKGSDKEKVSGKDKGKGKAKDEMSGKDAAVAEGHPVWFRASQICAHDRFQFGKVTLTHTHTPLVPHNFSSLLLCPDIYSILPFIHVSSFLSL